MSSSELPRHTTRDVIAPILHDTYGEHAMVRALADSLAKRLDAGDWDSRGREHMVVQTCWMWFSGGSTAESVGRRIEEALA